MKFHLFSYLTPLWVKRSIAVKVVIFVGTAIISLVALQTYININQMDQKLNPLVIKDLQRSLNSSNNIFNVIAKQTREDAQIIGSHNALTNYIDYAMLDDATGMNEEVVNLEIFLRSLTSFKTQYNNIEIITDKGSIIHLVEGKVAEPSDDYHQILQLFDTKKIISIIDKKIIEYAYFFEKNKQVFFTLFYSFQNDNTFIDGDDSRIIICITNNITSETSALVNSLQSDNILLSLKSNKDFILGLPENINEPSLWLERKLINNNIDLQLSVYKEKKHAFLLITDMENASFMLAIGSILVISISLLLTSRFVISAPLKSIINFINNDVLQKNNLKKRYNTDSLDEIGVFSLGLNNMLDQIQERESDLINSEERLALALWGGGEGMWELDFTNRIVYLDSGSCQILGLGSKPIKKAFDEFYLMIHHDDRAEIQQYFNEYITTDNKLFEAEFKLVPHKAHFLWIQLKGKLNKNNDAPGVTGTLRDITEEVRAEQEIQLYATVFNSSNDAITILDTDFHILAVNKAFSIITGYSFEDVAKNLPAFIQESDGAFSEQNVELQIYDKGYWHGEIVGKRKNNDIYVKDIDLNPVYGKDKVLTHYVCVFSDITEKKKSEKELWTMANYDILTKLPNRGYFRETLELAILNSTKANGLVALLFIDLDKFKQVNDTLGHDAGDELLNKVALLLSKSIRKKDTVARLGGDEFAIILEGVNSKENVESIAKKIIAEFTKGITVQENTTGVGASIGISFYPNDAKSTELLVHCADTAMYSAKTTGGNLYHFYHPTMDDHVNRRNQIEQELIKALKENSLSLYYQPQLDINTGKVVSFEALSRWFHPELGFICPDEFIPIAEETGLIAELGLNVFNQACKQLKIWHQQGYSDIRMAINISPKQFLLTDIHIDIAHSIKYHKIEAKYLELELTESLIIEDPKKIISMLNTLKSIGVRLSIDDFGTGYSSLSYLSKFPLDLLKIDKSFVQQAGKDKRGLALTKAIIGIAQSLDLEVIAEGVETVEQLNMLKKLGCNYMQGYYYSAAIPSKEADLLLGRHLNLFNKK
jgi:diguanylate cyclase (GGDEF)-like protein/PAS domain S-box-containing protein